MLSLLSVMLFSSKVHAAEQATVSVNGTVPSGGRSTLQVLMQATKYLSPLYQIYDGRVLISGDVNGKPFHVLATQIVDVTGDMATGVGTISADYVMRNVTHRIVVERSLDAQRKPHLRYWIYQGRTLVDSSYSPEKSKTREPIPVPLTGTSGVSARIW